MSKAQNNLLKNTRSRPKTLNEDELVLEDYVSGKVDTIASFKVPPNYLFLLDELGDIEAWVPTAQSETISANATDETKTLDPEAPIQNDEFNDFRDIPDNTETPTEEHYIVVFDSNGNLVTGDSNNDYWISGYNQQQGFITSIDFSESAGNQENIEIWYLLAKGNLGYRVRTHGNSPKPDKLDPSPGTAIRKYVFQDFSSDDKGDVLRWNLNGKLSKLRKQIPEGFRIDVRYYSPDYEPIIRSSSDTSFNNDPPSFFGINLPFRTIKFPDNSEGKKQLEKIKQRRAEVI